MAWATGVMLPDVRTVPYQTWSDFCLGKIRARDVIRPRLHEFVGWMALIIKDVGKELGGC